MSVQKNFILKQIYGFIALGVERIKFSIKYILTSMLIAIIFPTVVYSAVPLNYAVENCGRITQHINGILRNCQSDGTIIGGTRCRDVRQYGQQLISWCNANIQTCRQRRKRVMQSGGVVIVGWVVKYGWADWGGSVEWSANCAY